jgi:hypothetical protein
MSRSLSILAVAAAAVVAVPQVRAGETVRVEVPFQFVMAGQPLPGGEYRLEVDATARVVHVYSPAGRHVATALCQTEPSVSREVGLVFHTHAGQRFLKAVTTGRGFEVALPEVKAERAAAAQDASRPAAGQP